MLHKISDWLAKLGRWIWQAYLIVMIVILIVASVIVTVTGIAWCVIKLLAYLP